MLNIIFVFISAGHWSHLLWVEHPVLYGGDGGRPRGQKVLELGEVGEGEEEGEETHG